MNPHPIAPLLLLSLNVVAFVVLTTTDQRSVLADDKLTSDVLTSEVDYQQQVLPIFREHCFHCHGRQTQEGGLRLDSFARAEWESVIVAGNPAESLLWQRITLPADDELHMPSGAPSLSAEEREQIQGWIRQGAALPQTMDVSPHWAYQTPRSTAPPTVSDLSWVKNAVDAFVLKQLDDQQQQPAPLAAPEKQLRRVYFDLLGVPPSVEELDRFLEDPSDLHYERIVDQLLSRPELGQRWGRMWLDLARYADSHGFQRDDFWELWAFRDWVIDSLDRDLSFDRFTVLQLAGDLLPNASEEEKIATGFHRCVATNVEAGSLPEETRTEQVFDRVNTTATVWLGTTMECCQCHDHKYDPFSMVDYYRLFAYFNNTELEADLADPAKPSSIQFIGPKMKLADRAPMATDKNEKTATTLVMVERAEPRATHVLIRGDYRQHGEQVSSGTPEILPAFENGDGSRLELAQWLVDRRNPLVARVMVNRLWAELFGRGIVATTEDFGLKGDPPTHPQLLDWLAVQWMDHDWSIKWLLRTIVVSATYRQSSVVHAAAEQWDPQNQWLARGPRLRMDAEMIRDNLLAISGLLSLQRGGPSVRPYQPPGIWRKVGGMNYDYDISPEDRAYRRGIYVVLKRGTPYPSLINFDATPRVTCISQRTRTNTPLQALTLLNDPVYVEAATALAQRLDRECQKLSPAEKLVYVFRLCTGRRPEPRELQVLTDLHASSDLFHVATVLLNLHETITKD